jgi:hypothetical protein
MQATPVSTRIDDILVYRDRPCEDVLDDVYLKYHDTNPFMPVTHFVDHSTMGPEALVGLGIGHAVTRWIARHRARPYDAPVSGISIPVAWREAVGRKDCYGDWLRHFEWELSERPANAVLDMWVERFAHDVGTLLFHGLIRTAHAARALQQKDTVARRGELARGLALWAIGLRSSPPKGTPQQAANVDWTGEIMHCAEAGAATFVRKSTIPHLHLVTGPMAYLMIAPNLDARIQALAAPAFRRTHAKAFETFEADRRHALSEPNPSLDHSHLEALADKTDAHPAKLTEAALRAYQATGDSLFLKAAAKVQDYTLWRALVG